MRSDSSAPAGGCSVVVSHAKPVKLEDAVKVKGNGLESVHCGRLRTDSARVYHTHPHRIPPNPQVLLTVRRQSVSRGRWAKSADSHD